MIEDVKKNQRSRHSKRPTTTINSPHMLHWPDAIPQEMLGEWEPHRGVFGPTAWGAFCFFFSEFFYGFSKLFFKSGVLFFGADPKLKCFIHSVSVKTRGFL